MNEHQIALSVDPSGEQFPLPQKQDFDADDAQSFATIIGNTITSFACGIDVCRNGANTAGAGKVLRTSSLAITTGACLDLTDNDLIVQSTESNREMTLFILTDYIASGRGQSSDLWQGQGLISSIARTKPYTTLAIALTGQDVAANNILVKFTWDGDTTLDGTINADDYFAVDSGYITQVGGYANGDLNYDGVVNADDYFLIDSAYIGQSSILASTPTAPAAVQNHPKDQQPTILSQLFSAEPLP